jgi:glycosyltransferase involved in cell wall biosynthesis
LSTYLDRQAATPHGRAWEIIVADDGSTDRTAALVGESAATDSRIRLLQCQRHGKGSAVRRGMLEARGAWRFMADADLSMPPDNIARFFGAIALLSPPPSVVIGSREAPGARRIGEPAARHILGRIFNWLVQLVAVPGIRDTQCGFKLFSGEVVDAVFPHARIDSFAFDVELLCLARRAGVRITEVGIDWHCRVDSRVSLWRGAVAFVDIARVRWNLWMGRYRALPGCAGRSGAAFDRASC